MRPKQISEVKIERLRADAAVNNEKEKHRHLLETISYGIEDIDIDGKIIYANLAYHKQYGYSKDELIGGNILDLVADEAERESLSNYLQCLAAEQPPPKSYFGKKRTKKGEIIDVKIDWNYKRDQAGRVIGFTSVITDITEQLKREQELRNANDQLKIYKTLIDYIPQVIWIASSNGQSTYLNQAWEKWTGREIEVSLGTKWAESVHPDDIGPLLNQWENAYSLGKPYQGECRFVHRNGRVLYCSYIGVPIKDADKKVIFWAGINYDITELKKAQKSLLNANEKLDIRVKERTTNLNKANEKLKIEIKERSRIQKYVQKLSSVVEQTADNVMITDLNGIIEYVNPAFELLTGYTLNKVIGQTPSILKSGSHDISFYKELWTAIISGKVFRSVFINKKKNGDLFFEEKTIAPIRDKNGNITHFVSTGRDVTERIKSEENLENHRVKLRALASRLEGIREEEKINIARKIHDELGHALTEIQFDLRNLGRLPELQKIEIRDEINSISDQTHQTLETLKRIASDLRPGVLDKLGLDAAIEWQLNQFQTRTKIKCKQYIDDLHAEINSHKSTTVFRIFQEILTNIIRHSQADEVTVTLTIDHNHIVLKVKDNGIGITKDDLESVDSLGLLGMQERANMTGGDFKIARLKKGGTKVEISIPV